MMRGKQLRQFRCPTYDCKFLRGSVTNRFNCALHVFVATNRDGELSIRNSCQPAGKLGGGTLAGVYHLQNPPRRARWPNLLPGERGKTRADGKSEDADKCTIDHGAVKHLGGMFIREQDIKGRHTITVTNNRDRIFYEDY